MNVEWIGGPEDGKVFAVPDNFKFITIALPPRPIWQIDVDELTSLTIHKIEVEIERTKTGFIVRYPKELG